MFCSIKSRNDLKAVESMEIKALLVSKSTYDHLFLIGHNFENFSRKINH